MKDANDNELLSLLGEVLREADPVPAEVTEFALEIWNWPTVDADLARLVFDSIDEEPMATRSVSPVRMFSFETTDHTIEVEYDRVGTRLVGSVMPASEYEVSVVRNLDQTSTKTDEQGRFDVVLTGSGPLSFIVGRGSDFILRTEWVLIS